VQRWCAQRTSSRRHCPLPYQVVPSLTSVKYKKQGICHQVQPKQVHWILSVSPGGTRLRHVWRHRHSFRPSSGPSWRLINRCDNLMLRRCCRHTHHHHRWARQCLATLSQRIRKPHQRLLYHIVADLVACSMQYAAYAAGWCT